MRAINVGKKIYLGLFDFEDEEDAARMYDRGQIAYLGRGDRNLWTNFPVEEYSHELDWLEGLGVLDFAARLKAARKQLKAADWEVTADATLEVAKAGQGQPSFPGPQQQHSASDDTAEDEDEEIEIRQLACEDSDTPAWAPRLATGPASRRRRKRSPAPRDQQPAPKRQRSAAPTGEVQQQQQAAVVEDLRRDLREAELKIESLAEKCAGLERFNAHLMADCEQKGKFISQLLADTA